MSIFFLVFFAVAEIILTLLTLTKFREKTAWLKNRTIIRAIETALLFVIIVLPSTTMKWRFLLTFAILGIRLAVAVIEWLVGLDKAKGFRRSAAEVICCIVSVFLISFSMLPAMPFVDPDSFIDSGEYSTADIDGLIGEEIRSKVLDPDGLLFGNIPSFSGILHNR